MKKVFIVLGSLVLGSYIIQQLISNGGRKHITSREDDPSIPEISKRAF